MPAPTPHRPHSIPWWTIVFATGLTILNFGLFTVGPDVDLLSALEFDRSAIERGEVWRLLTFNLVHHSREHFLLDVGAFLALGWLSERHFPRSYPLLLLWIALCLGLVGLFLVPENARVRGLSGVNAGQFAAILWVEIGLARRDRSRWLWLAPATAFFFLWIGYGAVTGHGFLMDSTTRVAAWAHITGAVAAIVFLAFLALANRKPRNWIASN
jgi:rhomboid family GlyGly-CTERM serine protease